MSSCHDPYRELEIYLEKAQEEICKAFEELLQHEKDTSSLENEKTVIPPPPAFRSPSSSQFKCNLFEKTSRDELDCNTVSRVCYDGNVLNLRNNVSRYSSVNRSSYLLQKSLSCPADELHFSKVGNETREVSNGKLLANGGLTLLNHRRPCSKQLRPSLSFPEGAIDGFLREKVLQTENRCSWKKEAARSQTDRSNASSDVLQRSQNVNSTSSNNGRPRVRLRSFSGSSSVDPMLPTDEQYHTFPRPPSGDVNLLSIWADNLVLAVDKSLSEDLDESVESSSPLSDYSPSPSKHEEENNCGPLCPVEAGRKALPGFDEDDSRKSNGVITQQSRLQPTSLNSLKQAAQSPDSGVCDAGEDVVDFIKARDDVGFDSGLSLSLKIDLLQDSDAFDITHCITPPPPEFEDKDNNHNSKFSHLNYPSYIYEFGIRPADTTLEVKESKTQINGPILTAASNVAFVPDDILEEQCIEKVGNKARVLPVASMDIEECSTVMTVCVANDVPSRVRHFVSKATSTGTKCRKSDCTMSPLHPSSLVSSVPESETRDIEGSKHTPDASVQVESASTLPKSGSRANENDRYSCSLPRDAGRVPSEVPSESPQRSSSSSAVSSISQVSVDELAAFMRKVKKSTYHPPPRADVCIHAKDDNDQDSFLKDESNCDAVTQTTPVVPLSRSSSFTWITECDCSDWDSPHARSASEDSLLVFSCSNSDPEKKEVQTSSSLSSSADDEVYDVPQNSGCSSLYLSACSEASDSLSSDSSPSGSDKQEHAEGGESLQSELCMSNENSTLGSAVLDLAACESIKSLSSVGTLVDIAEESAMTETLSFCSVSSNSDTISKDQPASFPSTLKSRNRICESDMYRDQPIEANVLIVNELNVKSVSAPVLRQKRHMTPKMESLNDSSSNGVRLRSGAQSKAEAIIPSRAHSAKELNELQAIEACSWLRAAGFPQYAQMYEDNLFPIDICTVQKDHAFLHPDSIQSLFRRLNTLNRCARMKFVDSIPRKSLHLDDSDDEEQCALSENWQFQRISRRWSRVPSPTHVSSEYNSCTHDQAASPKPIHHAAASGRKYLTPEEAYSSSHDSVFLEERSSPDSIRKSTARNSEQYLPLLALREGGNSPGSSSGSGGTLSIASEDMLEKRWDFHQRNLHRSGSDRIKEGAKALLRRMESLKGKRKKKGQNHAHETSLCVNVNNGTDGSSCSSLTPSPLFSRQCHTHMPSPQDASDSSQGGTPQMDHQRKGFGTMFKEETEASAHSDSECPLFLVSEMWKDTDCGGIEFSEQHMRHQTTIKVSSDSQTTSCSPFSNRNFKKKAEKGNSYFVSGTLASKTNQLSVSPHQDDAKLNNRASHYDNFPAPLAVFNNACVESLDRDFAESGKAYSLTASTSDQGSGESNEGEIIIINSERRDSGVGASLTRGSSNYYSPWHSFPLHSSASKLSHSSIPITELSAPQILVLRKLSLLKLTTLMEKFSPSSRTGWSWAVPKFIRRIRTPDYKDKVVFGVPLLLVLQRTGQPLPVSIQKAIHYLRKTALDSTGLFRKSGVRSRIQKLRNLNENSPEKMSYDDQQAYDVADMLKQYFRELPEALLTNKLSETFISIFQYIPEELRLEAVQAAILLMPDENREVLQALLSFLQEVCQHSGENQMTATNLAVCFAPSLFQLTSPRSASASPRRRKTVGAPDLRELNENRAAYECLSSMVINYKQLCNVSQDMFSQSGLSYVDTSEPATVEELSFLVSKDTAGWRAYTYGCIQALLKEAKEKYKGWVSVSQSDGVDLSYKKAGDGHPLRLWKVSTEVEAPPTELLNRVLRERHVWDNTFLKWRVVQTLDKQTEVFQYVNNSLPPHPPCDYCVIRSWRTELQKGACALIEASVDHPEAKLMVDGVRAIILASRFLIEPCGSGKSRITHVSRVDTRGRSPEWYNRAYGHICTLNLMKLRDSFSHVRTEGPETKV